MEKLIYILTTSEEAQSRTACLELSIKLGRNSKYGNLVKFVRKEDNEYLFNEFVKKHNINSFPSLICDEKVLMGVDPNMATKFLSETHKIN